MMRYKSYLVFNGYILQSLNNFKITSYFFLEAVNCSLDFPCIWVNEIKWTAKGVPVSSMYALDKSRAKIPVLGYKGTSYVVLG